MGTEKDNSTCALRCVRYESSWRGPWEKYVTAHPQAMFPHSRIWADIAENVLGHQCCSLLAVQDEEVRGILPLFRVSSWLTGRFLVTAPGANSGGLLASDDAAGCALLQAASGACEESGAHYIEFRQEGAALPDLPAKRDHVTTVVRLESDPDAVRRKISKKIRRDLNRAKRDGLEVVHGSEFLADFYEMYARHMHRLGSPCFGQGFFASMAENFGEKADVVVVRQGRRSVAGNIAIHFNGRINNLYAGAEPEAMKSGAISLFCWEQIERGCRSGMQVYDFGRSTRGSSSHQYKAYWHGEDIELPYCYHLRQGHSMPDKQVNSLKFRLAASIWRKLPAGVVRRLGPSIVRSLH